METIQKPTPWNLKLYRGDRWPNERFGIYDQNDLQITTFEVKAQVRHKSTDSGSPLKEFIVGSGFILESDNTISFNSSVDLPLGSYHWDIQVILGNGHVYTIAEGRVDIYSDVTR